MRHVLLLPAALIGLFLVFMVREIGKPDSVGALGSIEFALTCLLEAVLVGSWIVACEVAAARKWIQAIAEDNQKQLSALRKKPETPGDE